MTIINAAVSLPYLGVTESSFDKTPSDSVVRIWCPQLSQEGSWQHITVVLAKAGMLKNSSVALYLNGSHVGSHKVCPIISLPVLS